MRLLNLVLPAPPSSPCSYHSPYPAESREDSTRWRRAFFFFFFFFINHLCSAGVAQCLLQMEPPSRVPTVAGDHSGGAPLGKSLARKIAVVVAAMVVLPALLILFTVGVALALPCALYLASFACADKLTSSLLGRPEELGAGNGDADGETVVDEDGGDGVEIPVDADYSSSASEVERPPAQGAGQESRDIEVEEITQERDSASTQEEASHGRPSPQVEEREPAEEA